MDISFMKSRTTAILSIIVSFVFLALIFRLPAHAAEGIINTPTQTLNNKDFETLRNYVKNGSPDDKEFRWRLMGLFSNSLSEEPGPADLRKLRNDLEGLLSALGGTRISNAERMSVLYLLAESNLKLGEYKGKKDKQDEEISNTDRREAYENAKQQYLRLKLMAGGKDNPMLSQVDKQLEIIESEIKRIDRKNWIQEKRFKLVELFISLFISVIVLFFLAYLFRFMDKWFVRREFGLPAEIMPEKDLITLEQLRRQDGRASQTAIDEYKENGTSDQYAPFVLEGHEMIKRLNMLAPWPLAIASKIPLLRKLPHFWNYTLIGLGSMALAGIAHSSAGGLSPEMPIVLFMCAAFITVSLYGLKIMAAATINAIDETICMMEPRKEREYEKVPKPIRDLEGWIRSLFRSPWQAYIILILYLIIFFKVDVTDDGYTYVTLIQAYFMLFIACPVIWFIFGSIITLNRICDMKDLAINPLSPIKTMGLEKWISVIGICNVTCSIVLSFGCLIPVVHGYLTEKKPGDWFWFFLFMPLLLFYWIYPHVKLGSMVKSMKIQRMQFLKIRISSVFNYWIKLEEGEEPKITQNRKKQMDEIKSHLDNYYEVFKRIDESPHSYLDIYSTLDLLRSLGIPSLFALITAYLL